MSVPRLPPDLRETARQWLERNPLNTPRRPRDLFKSLADLARCARLIERGCLVARGRGRYVLDDWCSADLLAGPPPSSPTP